MSQMSATDTMEKLRAKDGYYCNKMIQMTKVVVIFLYRIQREIVETPQSCFSTVI